ncbi:MAG: sodium/proline symporter [Acidobacteria bacterium]|nr:sodium/proline symporter [Acidobacteriota bacterium]
MSITLGAIVIGVYLAILIGIGIWTKSKVKGTADFNIGGRQVGLWVTALSFVAAYFSSVLIVGGGAYGYKFGLGTIWIAAANVLFGTALCWIVLGKRIRTETEKHGAETLSEFFTKRYSSPESGIYSAIIISFFLIIYNVAVLKGLGNLFEGIMDMPYAWGVLISGAVILIYVSIGGYLAVVWTSFVQACVMITALIIFAFFTITQVGGLTTLVDKLAALPSKIPNGFVETPGEWGWAGLISFALITSFGVWAMPQLTIRFYSIKNEKLLRVGAVVATIATVTAVIPYLCGAASRIILGEIESPDLAIPLLSKAVLPEWGVALFAAGVFAAGMSTFAGILIVISSAIVRDIYKFGMKKELKQKREVALTRFFSIIVGAVSIVVALKPPALVLAIFAFASGIIACTNFWPLVFGLYSKKVKRYAAFASMVAGSTVALAWYLAKRPFGIHEYLIGTLAGLLVMIIGNILLREKTAVKA